MNEIRNLINITDFTMEEIDHLIEIADDIMANPEKYQDICAHKTQYKNPAEFHRSNDGTGGECSRI